MGFLKGIFGGRQGGQDDPPRSLNHPRDLRVGDIVKFGFASQEALSNRTYMVESVDTCDLGGEAHMKTLFTIEGESRRLRLAVVTDRTGDRLELGLMVLPDDVRQIFDVDAFIDLLDPETGIAHVLERIGEPQHLDGWTARIYRQEAGHNAYYHTGDYRGRALPQDADEGTAFSYYSLVSDDRQFALEVQVYDGGRTEVYLLAYFPISKIDEMWPAK